LRFCLSDLVKIKAVPARTRGWFFHPTISHIAAQSGCGGMSAAGESGLCIVIATCAGGQRIAELDADIAMRGRARRAGM
jgi:hypothetical protein